MMQVHEAREAQSNAGFVIQLLGFELEADLEGNFSCAAAMSSVAAANRLRSPSDCGCVEIGMAEALTTAEFRGAAGNFHAGTHDDRACFTRGV